MTQIQAAQVQCPKCAHRQQISIYTSVTASRDEELKSAVKDGNIFDFYCEECDEYTKLVYDVLYHDPDKEIAIWFLPNGVSDKHHDAMDAFERMNPKTYKLRIAYTDEELAELIKLAECDVNDWFSELEKSYMYSVIEEQGFGGHGQNTLYFEAVTYDECGDVNQLYFFWKEHMRVLKRAVVDVPRQNAVFESIEPRLDWVHVGGKNLLTILPLVQHRLT